jgi:hypothetical protein
MDVDDVVAILLVVGVGLLFLCLLTFFALELRIHKWKGVMSNQFIKYTLGTNIALVLFLIVFIIQFYVEHSLSGVFSGVSEYVLGWIKALFWIFLSIAEAFHVVLLYMRTESVLRSSLNFLKFIKAIVIVFFVFIGLTCVTIIAIAGIPASLQSLSHGFSLANLAAKSISSGALAVIDILSTIAFIRYVRSIDESWKNKNVVIHNRSQQTELIARRGFTIALTSTTSFVAFLIQLITSNDVHTLSLLIAAYGCMLVGVMWMLLKMELDWKFEVLKSEPLTLSNAVAEKSASLIANPSKENLTYDRSEN